MTPLLHRLVPALCFAVTTSVYPAGWIPPGLPPVPAGAPALAVGAYLTPEQGRAALENARVAFANGDDWKAYADHLRLRIQAGAGLDPWPRRTPLAPTVHSRRVHDGYSVENVSFESVPGYFVTGNLYRPLQAAGSHPVVLATHGHAARVEKPEDYNTHARFSPSMQTRCAGLARMGAIVLSIDMFGYGDSIPQVGQDAHRQPFAMTLQLWNSMRAVDFLLSLEGADPHRVAVTGESGGGTQAFLLTALDPRVTASIPVVMISAHFFGGCPCESGQPIHRGPDHFASNPMIAALAAPRPQLIISDGADWTLHTPRVEYPFIRDIYALQGAATAVSNVHLANEGHDYGPSKRAALFDFIAKQFGLPPGPVRSAEGALDEASITIEPAAAMHAFNDQHPLPARALRDPGRIEQALKALQR